MMKWQSPMIIKIKVKEAMMKWQSPMIIKIKVKLDAVKLHRQARIAVTNLNFSVKLSV